MRTYKETKRVSVTPTVTAGAYSANDIVGGLLEFENAFSDCHKTGRIVSVAIADTANQTATYDLVFFKSLPATTYADNAAFDPSDADLLLIEPIVNVASSNKFAFADNSVTSLASLDHFVSSDTNTLYAVLVDRTGRTGAALDDITVSISIQQG